jgi:protein phosphatase
LTVVRLPEPCLVVLVGAAGSGKTTLARRCFEPEAILSSDAYRGLVSGDETNQAVTKVAFRLLHRDLAKRLRARRTAVVDATNVTAFARRSLVRRAAAAGVPAVAVVLALDPLLVRSRNATRPGRIVPEDAVLRQLGDLARSVRRGFDAEGFGQVILVREPAELDALTFEAPGQPG